MASSAPWYFCRTCYVEIADMFLELHIGIVVPVPLIVRNGCAGKLSHLRSQIHPMAAVVL